MQIDIIFIDCPHCRHWHQTSQVVSYTSTGQRTCWSDGKNSNPMYMSCYERCRNCSRVFHVDENRFLRHYEVNKHRNDNGGFCLKPQYDDKKSSSATLMRIKAFIEQENTQEISDFKDGIFNYISSEDPSSAEFAEAECRETEEAVKVRIEAIDNLPQDDLQLELRLRHELMVKLNDFTRNAGFPSSMSLLDRVKFWFRSPTHYRKVKQDSKVERQYVAAYSAKYEANRLSNLKRILELVDNDLFRVEVLRQLAFFGEASALLLSLKTDEHEGRYVSLQRKKIARKDSRVFCC